MDHAFVINCVHEVGDLFLKDFRMTKLPYSSEDLFQLYRSLEKKCLDALAEKLSRKFPNVPFAEDELNLEKNNQALDLPEYWICDSIDGAVQYMKHLPGWTINLLLIRDGEPYFSVIHDPLHNETYWAEKSRGAFLNDERIQVIGRPDIGLMLTATSHPPFPNKFPGLSARIGKGMQAMIETFSFVRNLGPTALQIAYVAAGRLDVFYEEGLDTFNWLPGVLIAQEAGAEVLTSRGIPWTWGCDSLLVSAPGIGRHVIISQGSMT